MGFFDTIKQLFGGAASKAEEAARFAMDEQADGERGESVEGYSAQQLQDAIQGDGVYNHSDEEMLDVAGFDPMNDEEAYFEAEHLMESEGMFGGTDADRERIKAQYGIRDAQHWHSIKGAVWMVLVKKHGEEEATQRMVNFKTQRAMQQQGQLQQATVASGALKPVEGISLEKWAAINAALVQGNDLDSLLKGNGIDRARWDRAKAEWEQRMSTDTTFAVAQVYGAAFQAASQSKYTPLAKEANECRAAGADLKSSPPMDVTSYFRLVFEQEAASRAGTDPQAALKAQGLSIVDWIDLSTFMGYYIQRNSQRAEVRAQLEQTNSIREEMLAKYPTLTKEDLDIQF